MNVLDWLRPSSVVRMLRHGPTWAAPAGVGPYWIEQAAREWSPQAIRRQDGSLVIGPTRRLIGPVPRDGTTWRAARMPSGSDAAYVERRLPHVMSDWPGGDLTAGLCRRFGGWWRYRVRSPWIDYRDAPAWPTVLSSVNLSPEELARLLDSDLPGLRPDEEPEYADAWCYTLESPQIRLDVTPMTSPDPWPLVQLQPWYDPTKRFTEYQLHPGDDGGEASLRVVDHVARRLADATSGLLVDCDGFPWRA